MRRDHQDAVLIRTVGSQQMWDPHLSLSPAPLSLVSLSSSLFGGSQEQRSVEGKEEATSLVPVTVFPRPPFSTLPWRSPEAEQRRRRQRRPSGSPSCCRSSTTSHPCLPTTVFPSAATRRRRRRRLSHTSSYSPSAGGATRDAAPAAIPFSPRPRFSPSSPPRSSSARRRSSSGPPIRRSASRGSVSGRSTSPPASGGR